MPVRSNLPRSHSCAVHLVGHTPASADGRSYTSMRRQRRNYSDAASMPDTSVTAQASADTHLGASLASGIHADQMLLTRGQDVR